MMRRGSSRAGLSEVLDFEISRPAYAVFLFALVSLVPLGSYIYLHRSLVQRYDFLERHLIEEMKEVTRLKREVAGLTRIKDSLQLTSSSLKAALRSFGRPLPAGLVAEDLNKVSAGAGHNATVKEEGSASIGGAGSTEDLQPGQQGYISVPPQRVVTDCAPDDSAFVGDRPVAWTKFFKQRKAPGFYVEIGAGDGVYESPTYFLENALCWTGILVEPTNEFSRMLSQRPRSACIHGAVCSANGPAEDFQDITLNGVWTGWSGFPAHYSNAHRAAVQQKTSEAVPQGRGGWEATNIKVMCFTLGSLLERQKVKHVDYLSVSVQGAELQVLQSMDFGKTTVDVLEVDVSSMLDDLKAFLLDKGLMHHSKHGTRTHVFVRQSGPSS